MAELNLKQIIDRLNTEFTGDTQKLVFWYDDNGEFAEDMKDIELENARVYYLEQDNQFYTKYFLEWIDTLELRSISETGCAREPSGGHTIVFPEFLCRSWFSVIIGFGHSGEV